MPPRPSSERTSYFPAKLLPMERGPGAGLERDAEGELAAGSLTVLPSSAPSRGGAFWNMTVWALASNSCGPPRAPWGASLIVLSVGSSFEGGLGASVSELVSRLIAYSEVLRPETDPGVTVSWKRVDRWRLRRSCSWALSSLWASFMRRAARAMESLPVLTRRSASV